MKTKKHFLDEPKNSVTRERIFLSRLEFDVRIAASRVCCPLSWALADVDREGFDITLDDQDCQRKLQVKTVSPHAPTQQWRVFKHFLRPTIEFCDHMAFEISPEGVGLGGGVVLMRITDLDKGTVEYSYTDLFVIAAFASQLVIREQGKKRRGPTVTPQSQASQLLKKLSRNQDPEHDNDAKYDHTRVTIPDGLFLHAKSPDHLLAFAMLHNRADNSYSWPANFAKAYRRFHTDDQGKALPDIDKGILSLARNGADCLIDLAHDRIRTFHQN